MSYQTSMRELGYRYLAELWLREASMTMLQDELKDCLNSPTLQGEGAAVLIRIELNKRSTGETT